MKQYNFIDLFSGAGGLLRGFMDAGFLPEFSVEMWGPAVETHRQNYPYVPLKAADIRTITNEELSNFSFSSPIRYSRKPSVSKPGRIS